MDTLFIIVMLVLLPVVGGIIYMGYKKEQDNKYQFQEELYEQNKKELDLKHRKFNLWYDTFIEENGKPTKIINLEQLDPFKLIMAFEVKEIIYINGNNYQFKDILSCTINNINNSTYKTTTDISSTIGRALVGGIIAGETGAIIGAVTAPQVTQNCIDNIQDSKYNIIITINSLSNPNLVIEVSDKYLADEIYSIMQVIINRNHK